MIKLEKKEGSSRIKTRGGWGGGLLTHEGRKSSAFRGKNERKYAKLSTSERKLRDYFEKGGMVGLNKRKGISPPL